MADSVKRASKSLKTRESFKKKIFNQIPLAYQKLFETDTSQQKQTQVLQIIKKNTKDLCSAVEVFDISDMDWAPSCSSAPIPPEVTEWQNKDQIAYWKSRAISLELENRMLHEHLRNVYAKTIEGNSKHGTESRENNENNTELDSEVAESSEGSEEGEIVIKKRKQRSNSEIKVKPQILPREPEGKNRLEEMKNIYGQAAPKIMGMETAVQLNYERLTNKLNPPYWPGLPLRLS
ncbi:hypothetical protein NQ317_007540 [Molorchus minor]|uniref:Uncharacterized protein n=1 Tax=Molorchus minor TaxID=1323400 RepID=A0ABQ9K445_9CUCU|nr:hypothetical protein NQ317_007540 [Molorchus minor]